MNLFTYRRFVFVLGLLLICGTSAANEAQPEISCDAPILEEYKRFYEPTDIPWEGAPDVVEFFSYNCNLCYAADPAVSYLKSKLPEGVEFQPYHIASENMAWKLSQYAFAAAVLGGVEERVHNSLYKRFHVDHDLFETKQDVRDFFESAGVAVEVEPYLESDASREFRDKIYELAVASEVHGTPTFVVRGKYRVRWGTDQTPEKFAQLILALIKKSDESRAIAGSCEIELTR